MKCFLIDLILLLTLMAISTSVRAADIGFDEPAAGVVICKPGVANAHFFGDCVVLGPSRYHARMAEKGIRLPFERINADQPDSDLAYVPHLYGQVVNFKAPVFGSAEDAAKGSPRLYRLEGGFNYISYTYTEVLNDVRVYMIAPGVWMSANDVHRIGTPNFQGLEFRRTPGNPFGWILQSVETKRTPGFQTLDYTGKSVNRFDVVQAYDIQKVEEFNWYMIRPGEWIDQRMISLVFPKKAAPEGVDGNRWIDINLFEQTVAVYQNNRLVFATVISSGINPFWTRPGLFQIYQKLESTRMSGSFEPDRSDYYNLEDVPWTMYYDEARALHGAYWHTGYGFPRSHGCVNMSPGDAQWLFHWATEGDWVYVSDPSGQTPTDPSLYTAGGA